ncbi:hypothetical protein [Gilliamella sp. BG1]|uniref:hypothetical protein n=1 Tax=Gilliamella sp. BG1 TaxID=3351508 RepID=UPI00398855FA
MLNLFFTASRLTESSFSVFAFTANSRLVTLFINALAHAGASSALVAFFFSCSAFFFSSSSEVFFFSIASLVVCSL